MASWRSTTDVDPLAWLNVLSPAHAEAELLHCCGSRRWARAMVASRPFASRAALLQCADDVWLALPADDWLEAFRTHPRIGDALADPQRNGEVEPSSVTRSARWSAHEQAGARTAPASVRDELANGNRLYEERFGHVFLICATGLSAEEMLAALHSRLHNGPATELRIAGEEQRKITHLRLERLLRP